MQCASPPGQSVTGNVQHPLDFGAAYGTEADFGRPTSMFHEANEAFHIGSTPFARAIVVQPYPTHPFPPPMNHFLS